jgi:hypothetical protein
MDTQLSAFWNQHVSRQLSVFAHNIALPGPRNLWEATTASEWLRLHETISAAPHDTSTTQQKSRPGYLPGLHPEFQVSHVAEGFSKAVLYALSGSDSPPYRVDHENALTVEMLLMGLMATAWDCRTRGGMGIRLKADVKQWRGAVMGGRSSSLIKHIVGRLLTTSCHSVASSMGAQYRSSSTIHRDPRYEGYVCHFHHLRLERHVSAPLALLLVCGSVLIL